MNSELRNENDNKQYRMTCVQTKEVMNVTYLLKRKFPPSKAFFLASSLSGGASSSSSHTTLSNVPQNSQSLPKWSKWFPFKLWRENPYIGNEVQTLVSPVWVPVINREPNQNDTVLASLLSETTRATKRFEFFRSSVARKEWNETQMASRSEMAMKWKR